MEWGILLPNTVALGAVALLGYMFGRSALRRPRIDPKQVRQDFQRAREVVAELESISLELRRNLAAHQGSTAQIRKRLAKLKQDSTDPATEEFCQDVERWLLPPQQLTQEMSQAYNALRAQSTKLTAFADVRVDPLTGLSSRRAMDESLAMLLAMKQRYHQPFAIVLLAIDDYSQWQEANGETAGQQVIRQVAEILQRSIRETDIAARFSGAEFVMLLPETDLEGAAVLARRVRRLVQRDTDHTVSSGLAAAMDGDTAAFLMRRAQMSLNASQTDGCNSISQHDGTAVSGVPTTPFLSFDDDESRSSTGELEMSAAL